MNTSRQFGLTQTTGAVQGEVRRYEMDAYGKFSSLPTELDSSAIDNLTPDEVQALEDDLRLAPLLGFYRKGQS